MTTVREPLTAPAATRRGQDDAPQKNRYLRRKVRLLVVSTIMLAINLVWIYPLLWMVGASLKDNAEVFRGSGLFSPVLHLENYVRAWTDGRVADYFLNTVLVTAGSIVISVIAVAMMGYVLGRYRFPGKKLIIGIFAIVIFLPEGYTIIPVVDVLDKLNLDSSLWGLTLAEAGGAHVVATLLFAGYFSRLPAELGEAATMDGAGFLRTFWSVYLPLAKPVTAVAIVLQFMHSWNDFLLPLVMTLADPGLRTIAVGMYAFRGEEFTDWSGMMSAATIGLVPIVVLFLFLQRYFVEGVAGAVKQ